MIFARLFMCWIWTILKPLMMPSAPLISAMRYCAAWASDYPQHIHTAALIARIGGDEFAILEERIEEPRKQIQRTATRILEVMSEPLHVGDHVLDVSCSVGVVMFPTEADTVIDVVRSADNVELRLSRLPQPAELCSLRACLRPAAGGVCRPVLHQCRDRLQLRRVLSAGILPAIVRKPFPASSLFISRKIL